MEYLQIGNVKIKKTAALAPMAGGADYAFRKVAKEYGAAYVVSEMASCKGMVYSDRKTAELLTVTDFERPMAVQLFGCEPEFVAPAVKIAEGFNPDIIDINSGCPVPKVAGNGSGSALMKNPKLFAEMITAAVKATNLPVTVKIRKGWDDSSVNAVEIARIAEECGAAAVAVHGRTKNQMYSGNADWDIIAAVKQAVKIPVIGNGDVDTPEKCAEMYRYTGCDLVMIGRGSYGNPFVFREIDSWFSGKPYTPPTVEEKMEVMLRHIRLIISLSEKSEEMAMHEARKHAAWYMNGCYGSAKFRGRCYQLSSYEEAVSLSEEFIELQHWHSAQKNKQNFV